MSSRSSDAASGDKFGEPGSAPESRFGLKGSRPTDSGTPERFGGEGVRSGASEERASRCVVGSPAGEVAAERPAAIVLPDGLRWATGGGIGNIDGCNGRHIARGDIRGTLCGRYGPAIMREPKSGETICKTCAKIAGVPHVVS